jgi:hypothetical protein
VTDRFYLDTLTRFIGEGVIAPADRFLVSCGGQVDHDTLLAAGFTDVVITNLDERMDVYNEYAPYEWRHEDAEALPIVLWPSCCGSAARAPSPSRRATRWWCGPASACGSSRSTR